MNGMSVYGGSIYAARMEAPARPPLTVEIDVDALPARPSEIAEIAEARLVIGDEQAIAAHAFARQQPLAAAATDIKTPLR